MTKKEAIELLDNLIGMVSDSQDNDYDTALKMAIEALFAEAEEFEWCDDCKEYDQEAHCCHRWTKVIRNTVEELKAEWKGEWIPCSERLPEVGEDIFISVGERVCEAHLRASKEYFLIHSGRMLVKTEEADAWMPLPEPYMRGEEDV